MSLEKKFTAKSAEMDVFAMKCQSDCVNFDVHQKSALKNNERQKSVLKKQRMSTVSEENCHFFSALTVDVHQKSALKNNACQKSALKSAT